MATSVCVLSLLSAEVTWARYVVGSLEAVGVGVVLAGERLFCYKLELEGSVCLAVGRRVWL